MVTSVMDNSIHINKQNVRDYNIKTIHKTPSCIGHTISIGYLRNISIFLRDHVLNLEIILYLKKLLCYF